MQHRECAFKSYINPVAFRPGICQIGNGPNSAISFAEPEVRPPCSPLIQPSMARGAYGFSLATFVRNFSRSNWGLLTSVITKSFVSTCRTGVICSPMSSVERAGK